MKTFKGGVHPKNDWKYLTNKKKIETIPISEKVVIPISQHIGIPAKVIVKKGDKVKVGELIAKSDGFISANIHSSVTGVVENIIPFNHPLSDKEIAIIISVDKDENQEFQFQSNDWTSFNLDEIKEKIKNAGIVGLGGATFPTHVKLSPPKEKNIDTLIINAVECEPYLTADHRLMLENKAEIIEGIKILKQVLDVKNSYIGIESNKRDAYEKFLEFKDIVSPEILKLKYPQGAEKQLIDAITKRKVPSGKLPMDVGCIVVNVGTVFAIYEAVVCNKPLIDRIVTVSGKGIKTPKNLKVKIGTLWADIINFCDGVNENVESLIMGGPMMGMAQFTDEIPFIKGTSGILLLTKDEIGFIPEQPCIRCGECVRGCPMNLMPSLLDKFMEYNKLEELYKHNILDCIECGTCVYVCPANKKFVQKIRKFKPKVIGWAKKNVGI